jgi:hypothetical protein
MVVLGDLVVLAAEALVEEGGSVVAEPGGDESG